ncbi:type VII secretion target [Nocardia camponoti]|uniref:ESX-1 secretion-associated protein n=1 Tax=Nocardia camponoti TaxID=1616106 RepID=A0A917QBA4_9NOCA|nr:type VII secretion target [Nocardia camponoti]GGK40631.1 hypothetical protein GCM10011591_10270 [Nocardia camponoti]
MLKVDIDNLNQLATTVGTAATDIDNLDVRTLGDTIGAALPGCQLGAACSQAGEFVEGAWLRASQRLQKLSTLVRESASAVQLTDEEFKKRLDTMDFVARGER